MSTYAGLSSSVMNSGVSMIASGFAGRTVCAAAVVDRTRRIDNALLICDIMSRRLEYPMPDQKLVGQNYTPPDLIAKVTGRAKYAEDYRAEGMLFCKLLLSPMPHCRVRSVDARAALAMPGVKAILRASELPAAAAPALKGHEDAIVLRPEVALTDEPVYEGEPILAVAAVDEVSAADAIERIGLELDPLPFVVDPLESLRPSGPNARLEGNAYVGQEVKTIKWSPADFAAAADGSLPMGEAGDTWQYG